jgi:hypothetical protein
VKPQNVIVRADDAGGQRAKLMDFGIARLEDAPGLTATGEVLGTLAYMAPEQAEGEGAGAAADVYSLALTLYECWAGENPVRGSTPAQTARAIGGDLPPLAMLRPDLPAGITDVIDACLDPDAELRPPLTQLAAVLAAQMHWLDDEHLLPGRQAPSRPRLPLAGLLAASGALLAAPLLGAATLGGAFPALAGAVGRSGPVRFALGVAGWLAMLVAAVELGLSPHLGIGAVLADPASLLGAAVFGVGAVTFGWISAARHVALASLGAVLWAGALAGALGLVGNGALAERPLVIAAGALVATFAIHGSRATLSAPQARTRPRARPLASA